jgi:methionyl-tRNA formyltransferase
MRSTASPVKALALARGLALLQPESLRNDDLIHELRIARADVTVVAAYGLLLPAALLQVARHGAINVHASRLPRWRGAAPIQRALLAGDEETGVSIMRMEAGLDTGPVFTQRRLAIGPQDDFGSLHDRLAELGAGALIEVLSELDAGRATAHAQGENGVTYAPKIEKSETWLRWDRPAAELERVVRAFRPQPGALTRRGGEVLKIWRARVVAGSGAPGSVLESTHGLHVACGADALSLEELQPAGGRRMPIAAFLRGRRLPGDARFQ